MRICKLTTFFLMNLLQQGTRTCFCLIVCRCKETCFVLRVLSLLSILSLFGVLIQPSLPKFLSTFQPPPLERTEMLLFQLLRSGEGLKDRLLKKLFWEHVASFFMLFIAHFPVSEPTSSSLGKSVLRENWRQVLNVKVVM